MPNRANASAKIVGHARNDELLLSVTSKVCCGSRRCENAKVLGFGCGFTLPEVLPSRYGAI